MKHIITVTKPIIHMMSCQGRVLFVFLIVCIAIKRYYYVYSNSDIQSIQLRSNEIILLVMSITTQEDVIHFRSLNCRFHHLSWLILWMQCPSFKERTHSREWLLLHLQMWLIMHYHWISQSLQKWKAILMAFLFSIPLSIHQNHCSMLHSMDTWIVISYWIHW